MIRRHAGLLAGLLALVAVVVPSLIIEIWVFRPENSTVRAVANLARVVVIGALYQFFRCRLERRSGKLT